MMDPLSLKPLEAPYFEQLQALIQHPNFKTEVLHVERTAFDHFQCTQCGDCCTSAWGIHLSQRYHTEWYSFFDQHPSGRFRQPFILNPVPTAAHYADIRRLDNHRCLFLEPDNSCYIHRHHGEEALSEVCRLYPRGHKRVQNFFSTRLLVDSCEAVPDVLAAHPGLQYGWLPRDPHQHLDSQNFNVAKHLPADQNFLWLGLGFDVLAAPTPASVFQRWRLYQEVLKAILPEAINESTSAHWELVHRQIKAQLPLYFPLPLAAKDTQRALQWMIRVMPHPPATQWLQNLSRQQKGLPALSNQEQSTLHQYLQIYLENRLLGICYGDLFWGKANFWEQNLMLTLSVIAIQTLARYYASESQTCLAVHHLQRASVHWSKKAEQQRGLLAKLSIKGVTAHTASQAIQILLALTPLQ
jgi:Fe-S-cluster containining protein